VNESIEKPITLSAPRDLAQLLRIVAAHRDMTMIEALDKFLRPALDREYRKILDAENRDVGGEGG
jgi:hypothetical protein